MKPFICVCCGEERSIPDQMDSENPNICKSCAALAEELTYETPKRLNLVPAAPAPSWEWSPDWPSED